MKCALNIDNIYLDNINLTYLKCLIIYSVTRQAAGPKREIGDVDWTGSVKKQMEGKQVMEGEAEGGGRRSLQNHRCQPPVINQWKTIHFRRAAPAEYR